jgi:hypothetical protein
MTNLPAAAVVASLALASPASAQVIEPTCADFMSARAAGTSLVGYDARVLSALINKGQSADTGSCGGRPWSSAPAIQATYSPTW